MKRLLLILIFIPVLSKSQSGLPLRGQKGIVFIQGMSWQNVLNKARVEGKSIFVDCYTTWCGPCKKLDKEVFSDEQVGKLFNNKFVCYKLQMDSTGNDDEIVKASYQDAHYFRDAYKVFAFPTSMFFSSDGKLLNRREGLTETADFIKTGEDVLDPSKNYYSLLEKYNKGERSMDAMRLIIQTASILLKDTATAMKVSKDFMERLNKEDYLTKDNIEFFQRFTKKSTDIGFIVFYKYSDSVNKIMDDKMYAQSLIRSIIFKEMVLPHVKFAQANGKEPDWITLEKAIKKKYNNYYAELVITAIKLDWYKNLKNWPEYIKSVVAYVDGYVLPAGKQGPWPALTLNNFAWDIFQYSHDKTHLIRALAWSSKAVMMDPNPNWMDTYANLLYKLGNIGLAVKWEEAALKLAPTDNELPANLQKMKTGKPTWQN
jgi:thioredoxin-related protein